MSRATCDQAGLRTRHKCAAHPARNDVSALSFSRSKAALSFSERIRYRAYIDDLTGAEPGTSIEPVIVAQLIYFYSLFVVGKRRLHCHDGGIGRNEWTSASGWMRNRLLTLFFGGGDVRKLDVGSRDTEQVGAGWVEVRLHATAVAGRSVIGRDKRAGSGQRAEGNGRRTDSSSRRM